MDNRTSPALEAFRAFIQEKEWTYDEPAPDVLRGNISGEWGRWLWVAQIRGEGSFLVFNCFSPVNVSAKRRGAAAEYLSRVNWGLNSGSFEMDWTDGQVACRTAIVVESPELPASTISHLVYANCQLMDRYVPGLMRVACGNTAPKKAIADAEKDLPPRNDDAPADSGPSERAMPTAGNNMPAKPPRESEGFSPNNN